VRMHNLEIFEDIFGRTGPRAHQLQASMRAIAAHGQGVVVLLRTTGELQFSERVARSAQRDQPGKDVVLREYGIGAQVLVDLGVKDIILLTNSRRHLMIALEGYGLNVVEERTIPPLPDNRSST
jgi:3,4-dihydroxy 2-butanone 4-phosphate synthase / GTP cyclohydrolase II